MKATPPSHLSPAFAGLLVAAWIAATVALIEPLQAALLNWEELTVGSSTLLLRLAKLAVMVFAALAPVIVITCWLAPTRGGALWIALCLALWAQGDLFVWDYGTFDGAPLDWTAHRGKAWLEAAVWLGAPAFALWRPAWLAKHAVRILGAVVVLQGVGLSAAGIENAPFADRPPFSAQGSGRAEFATLSSNANVVVVVLDMVQSDIFAEAMRSDELAERMPEGFVYYRNAVSLYLSTQFSLQSILTSQAVPDGVNALQWRVGAMRASLPAALESEGFESRLASFAPANIECTRGIPGVHCAPLQVLAGAHAKVAFENTLESDVSLLANLGLFRLAPHWLKSHLYLDGEWSLRKMSSGAEAREPRSAVHHATRMDLEVLDTLAGSVHAEDVAPRFRFVHLSAAHFPASIDARCEAVVRGDMRRKAVATTRCMLRRLYRLFDRFGEAGVYDQTLIVVVSDHGYPLVPPEPSVAEPPLAESSGAAGSLDDWWRGLPLFLVKTPGARGPLRISDRPVSLCDVPATVLDVLRIKDRFGFACESVLTPTRESPRMHYRYPSYADQKLRPRRSRYRFQFERFRVTGHSWHPESWQREGP